jgi:hypothetical protein
VPLFAIHLFLLQVAAGVALTVCLTKLRSLGHGFYQIHLAVAFVAITGSLLLGGDGAGAAALPAGAGAGAGNGWMAIAAPLLGHDLALKVAAALLLLVATFLYSFARGAAGVLHAGAVALLLALLAAHAARLGAAATWGDGATLLFLASTLLGALLLGLGVVTMNVGHWYLVNPRLGIGHLGLPTLLLFYLMLARGFLLLVAAGLTVGQIDPAGRTTAGLILDHAFFEGARIIAGWLFPAALAWMAVKTTEIRATQSATGILYALLVLLAIGEALGSYLTVTRLIPW